MSSVLYVQPKAAKAAGFWDSQEHVDLGVMRRHSFGVNSVVDGTEMSLIKLTEPTREVTQCEIKKDKEDVKQCCSEEEKHKECKSKVFTVAKGQCSLSVKNKIEADKDHKDWKLNDNVVASMKRIKELLCSTFWMIKGNHNN